MPLLRLLVVLGLGASLLGCPSTTTITSARTLSKGHTQVILSPSLYVETIPLGSHFGTSVVPSVELQLHHGITDHVEFSTKVSPGGFGVHTKVALLRPESSMDGFNISVDPGISYGSAFWLQSAHSVFLYVPLLVGYRFGGTELTLGTRAIPAYIQFRQEGQDLQAVRALYGGASLGLSIRISDSLRIVPEVNVVAPILSSATDAAWLTQYNLGFVFGSESPASNAR